MERRKFIQLSALSSASAFLLNGRLASAFNKTHLLNSVPLEIIEDRCLVLVQMRGGNDGLNTVIPTNQYDDYANLRPTIKLDNTGVNTAIELDSTLPVEDQVLLHPSLTTFKELYDEGKLNIIQGVGYPIMNKSHFAARALMLKGGDGTPVNANKDSGWMARYLQSKYEPTDYLDPLGIQLGSKKPSLGFHSGHEHKVDVNLTDQDISGFYSILSNLGDEFPLNIPDSDFGDNLNFINNVEINANLYAQRISDVFDAGSNSLTYPDYDLADQLKTVAKMIKGGSKTKIFLVSIDGFDNHNGQVAGASNSHEGKHADLLTELGESISVFHNDLEAMGLDEQVVTATFTEFGRKPRENGNLGTDHGNLGPMFVIGTHVRGGMSGTNLDLSGIVKHYDEANMQSDYRQTFSTLLSDFLGASEAISDTEFVPYDGENKLDLIKSNQVANESLGFDDFSISELTVFPNPVEGYCNIRLNSPNMFRGALVVYNMQGGIAFQITEDFVPGDNRKQLNLSHLSTGIYILAVKDADQKTKETFKIIKS